MFKKGDIIVGLDIGTTKICTVIAEIDRDMEKKIIGIGISPSKGLRKGVVVDMESTTHSIAESVEKAEAMAGCEVYSVYAGIASDHIKSFNTQGSTPITRDNYEIIEEDIQKAIESAKAVSLPLDRMVLDYLPFEYRVDGNSGISDPVGMSGVKLEVGIHVVTASVTAVQNIEKCIERAGFEVEKIVLEPLASSMSTLSDEELEMGVVLIDIGGGTTDTAIFLDKKIHYSDVVPFGGVNISSDIAFGLKIPPVMADEIKRKYGSCISRNVDIKKQFMVPGVIGRASRNMTVKDLASIIEVRMEEILMFVRKHIEKSGFQQKIGSGIVLTGGCSMMADIRELAEKIFNIPVRIGRPRGFSGMIDVINSPIYATGVGLVHYGLIAKGMAEDRKVTGKITRVTKVLRKIKTLYKGGAE